MRWTLRPQPRSQQVHQLQKELKVPRTIAYMLVQRGITDFETAKKFFRPQLSDLHDPFLMKGMAQAVSRIEEAIHHQEHIMVYGDYDVDGTTSVALMHSYLKTVGAISTTYIPDRYQEGYGLSYQGIDHAEQRKVGLIITLDCGIKAIEKVAYARQKGIDVIICDHHRPGAETPKAYAVLDPQQKDCAYPYKELCGCGVGFKLVQGLEQRRGNSVETLSSYLDLVATAIAADIVPITGENRILAHYGLQVLNQQPRTGFRALLQQAKKERLTITDVVFTIAPRINAAGRMEHALYAVELLEETDWEKALQQAKAIENFNTERKEADTKITQEALFQVTDHQEEENYTTVVYDEGWHKGVIGIVASRLTETYYRPTLVFTKSGNRLAASARSVKGFDIYNALEACREHIEQFGGHKYAAGLTLEEKKYPAFKQRFEEVVKKSIPPSMLTPEINIDVSLDFDAITPKFYRILKQFSPFGPGNMTPVFYANNLMDTGFAKTVGKEDKHLKCALQQEGHPHFIRGIGFQLGGKLPLLENKNPIEAVYSLDENTWNGETRLQLKLRDIR